MAAGPSNKQAKIDEIVKVVEESLVGISMGQTPTRNQSSNSMSEVFGIPLHTHKLTWNKQKACA